MNQVQILLICWVSVSVLATISGIAACYFQKKPIKKLSLADFINLSLASAAIVSSLSLIYKAATSEQLINFLGFDAVTLFLGAIAVIWLSVQQIWNLFKQNSFSCSIKWLFN